MPSKYLKTNWNNQDPRTPLNAANLNKMEIGIEEAHLDATSALDLALSNAADITQNANDISQVAADATAYTDAIAIKWLPTQDGDTVAAPGNGIFSAVDGTHNILLPTGSHGISVTITDAGTIFTYDGEIWIQPAPGDKIMNLAEPLILDSSFQSVTLTYEGTGGTWLVVSKA